MSTELFNTFLQKSRTLMDLGAASSVLNWDQETYMPNGAAQARAEQQATIDTLIHQLTVSPDYTELLGRLGEVSGEELEGWQIAAIREAVRSHDRASKLPEEFVGEVSRAQSLAQHTWKRARAEKNFEIFAPSLTHLVELKRRTAEYYGYKESPYDALIDLYEPGMTAAELKPIFDRLRVGTQRLLKKIADSGSDLNDAILFTDYDQARQLEFGKRVIERLGFSFETGRVDLSAHPFCTSFGPSDVRLTTRVYRDDLRSCLFGLIHEAGHGMYEQGFDPKLTRTELAAGISMGIHESQSLLWENTVARSEPFWNWAFPTLQSTFPEQLASVSAFDFYRAINVMRPSFIRVEADELTYNLHIILRFEIEEALITGKMEVADIPAVWNAKMTEYLGVTPADDAQGCLQDVHWSFGGFGYFPSYTLGKLYAAMFINQAERDIDDLKGKIGAGDFTELLAWLRTNIHRWGKSKTAAELVMDVCGRPLSEADFLDYLDAKIERVYYPG